MIFDNNTVYQTLRVLVCIFGTLGMVVSISRIKENKRKNLLIIIGYVVYSIAFSVLCIRFPGFMPFLRSSVFTISLPGVVITFLIADESLSRHIFCCLSELLLSLYLTVGVTQLNTLLGGGSGTNLLLLLSAYLIVIFAEAFFLRAVFLNIADTVIGGWGILAMIPCSFFILTMVLALYPAHYTQNESFPVLFALSGAVLLIIYYAVFQYLRLQYRYRMEEQDRDLLRLQIENNRKQAKDAERKAEELRSARRSIRQTLSVISDFAREGNAKAILDYIKEVSRRNDISAPARYCDDPILNATLAAYSGRAERSGIEVGMKLSLPEKLPVDAAELAICFSNALENAVNACEMLPKEQRRIIIRCIHKPQFMFEIENPYCGKIYFDRNGLPRSDRSGHGIGTRSITAFCEKYNAFYSFSAEDGRFKLVIAL